jgi:hypothetical protein
MNMKWRVCLYNPEGKQIENCCALTLIKAMDLAYTIANSRGDIHGITFDYVEDVS